MIKNKYLKTACAGVSQIFRKQVVDPVFPLTFMESPKLKKAHWSEGEPAWSRVFGVPFAGISSAMSMLHDARSGRGY